MSANAHADNQDANNNSFAVTALGDHQFGTNGIGVWPSTGQVRIGISNALSSTLENKFDGVGLLVAQLSRDDLNLAIEIHHRLCRAAEAQTPPELQVDPMMRYSAGCIRDGKIMAYQGRVGDLPKSLAFLIGDFFRTLTTKYMRDGQAIVKFDATVADVQRQTDKFMVSVKFSNSGRYPIRMRTPDQWSKLGGDRLEVSGFRSGGNGEWRADLAGLPILNKNDYSVETIVQPMGDSGTFVTIPEGGCVTYQIVATPADKVPNGAYKFGALVFANINVRSVYGVGGRVNFVSDRTKPGRVTFDADYPSTPQEWKDYEARKRERLVSQHALPGATITEAGYYRNVSPDGERGQFVVGLKKGEKTPMLERPFDRWEWEADLALPTRCDPGKLCPRDGRWVARTMKMGLGDKDATHAAFEQRMSIGQVAPDLTTLGGIVSYHYWQWLGA